MVRVFRHYLPAGTVLLFIGDLIVISSIYFLAARVSPFLEHAPNDIAVRGNISIAFAAVLSAMMMYAIGLYDNWLITDYKRALPRLIVCCGVCLPLVVLFWLIQLPNPGGWSDTNQALQYSFWVSLTFVAVLIWRVVSVAITRAARVTHRVLVVGTGRRASDIEAIVCQCNDSNLVVVGYTNVNDEAPLVPPARTKSFKDSFLEIAREERIKEIVVALDERRGVPVQTFLDARMEGITVTNYLAFWEREMRRVNLNALDASWLIYSDGFRLCSEMNIVLKRLMDVSISVALLIIMAPALALCCVAIKSSSPGPVLFRQKRVGLNGVPFTMYKFRTMRVDAEASGLAQWATVRDPRATRIGLFLRLLHIDELPQLVNVLRGDMSFVGPRPERPFFVESLSPDIPFYSERHRVRPGITGWAQVNYPYGASIEDARIKLSYDLYYIKNYSVLFDILIILSTASAVLFSKGAR